MGARTNFDELNTVSSTQSDRASKMSQIRTYFEEMDLEEYEIEERINLADDLETFFRNLFLMMFGASLVETSGGNTLESQRDYYADYAYRGYTEVLTEHGYGTYEEFDSEDSNSYMAQYIKSVTDGVVDTTILNIADNYYHSMERSIFCAENESNAVANYYKEQEAIKAGYTLKTWVTKHDRNVRKTHMAVDGKTVSIFKPFTVGESTMMFPLDQSLGASLREICRCRCVCKYSGKNGNRVEDENIEMYRKKGDSDIYSNGVSKPIFDKITQKARKQGARFAIADGKILERLIEQKASSVTYGLNVYFAPNHTISDVLEETHHIEQNLNGMNSDKDNTLRTILNEIDAKKYLISVEDKYKIPIKERELTRKQLENYERNLDEYYKNN